MGLTGHLSGHHGFCTKLYFFWGFSPGDYPWGSVCKQLDCGAAGRYASGTAACREMAKEGFFLSILYPDARLFRVTAITKEFLEEHGLRGLILDVDNTLTTHNNPQVDEQVLEWLSRRSADGIAMIILSNNSPERVQPFAEALKLPFVANALKPRRTGYEQAIRRLGIPPGQIAAVGDQVFTDIAGGNRCGLYTILVEPFDTKENAFIRLKRAAQRRVLRRYERRRDREKQV